MDPVIRSISEYDHDNPVPASISRYPRGSSVEPKNKQGNILLKLGNLDDALKKAQFLLDNKPKDENYLYLKGRVLDKLDRNTEAEKWFKEALDINPKFSQAAFYLAAIENKKGNFEKSIELYNYALSKDQIPKSGSKASTPFVSIDIGVACDNTIKANISGGASGLISNLKSLSSINAVNTDRQKYVAKSYHTKEVQRQAISGCESTDFHTSVKDDRNYCLEKEFVEVDSESENSSDSQKLPESAPIETPKPILNQKKLRKAWRIAKSGQADKTHNVETEIIHKYPQDFYSLGNSINKTESKSVVLIIL